jgi:hypothetical protein
MSLAMSLGYKTPKETESINFEEATRLIENRCPPAFLSAVKQSGRFFYRGESITESCILQPPPDLLDPSTYGSEEALAFFQCLENRFQNSPIRPSIGHIGTAKRDDATAWGDPCSIWPLESDLHYMWPRASRLFYPGSSCKDEFVVDLDLASAFTLDKEIMFLSSSFLVIPEKYEKQLRQKFFFFFLSENT